MFDTNYSIDESFVDDLDELNTSLSDFCQNTSKQSEDIITFVEKADNFLRQKGLRLDHQDIESAKSEVEDPADDEAVSFHFPIYREDEQSEYTLVVWYFASDADEYQVDMEVRYVWEDDDELEEIED